MQPKPLEGELVWLLTQQ